MVGGGCDVVRKSAALGERKFSSSTVTEVERPEEASVGVVWVDEDEEEVCYGYYSLVGRVSGRGIWETSLRCLRGRLTHLLSFNLPLIFPSFPGFLLPVAAHHPIALPYTPPPPGEQLTA